MWLIIVMIVMIVLGLAVFCLGVWIGQAHLGPTEEEEREREEWAGGDLKKD